MQQVVEKVFFALLRFEINGTQLCDVKKLITPDILPDLFKLSKSHDLVHLIGNALDKNGLLIENSKAKQYFLQERNIAILRYEQQRYELERIKELFEKERIAFIPLKGSIVREYYPEPWMRTSCDIDILIEEKDFKRAVLVLTERLKFTAEEKKDYHDLSLYSESGVHIELHYSLCENIGNIDKVLSRAWEYAIEYEGKTERKLQDEFFAFYIVAHMLYHFQHGGCGVRPLLDLWLLKKYFSFGEQFDDMLIKSKIKTFYKAMFELSECWFGQGQFNEKTILIQDYLLNAGVYGTKQNSELADTIKSGNKKKRLIRYIFLPYENMVILYPVLKKAKILLPFFHVWRWITRLFRIKKAVKHTKSIVKQDQSEIDKMRELFNILEI